MYTNFTGKMSIIRYMLLGSLVVAWNPVRSGALVKQVGGLIIVDESVTVILNFENVTQIRETLLHYQEGLEIVKSKLDQLKTTCARPAFQNKLSNKFVIIERKLEELLENLNSIQKNTGRKEEWE